MESKKENVYEADMKESSFHERVESGNLTQKEKEAMDITLKVLGY